LVGYGHDSCLQKIASMKITNSCYGRFHMFDQAAQLYRHNVLHRLINDYPKCITRRWGIPDSKVTSMLLNGIYGRGVCRLFPWLSFHVQSQVTESIHHQFSSRLANHLPADSDIFIGLSSFCLEAIERAKEQGIVTIVDHGSLHQEAERRIQFEEAELWGLPIESGLPPHWLIEKENQEFRSADRVIVLSEIAKRTMVESGIPESKIFVTHCGVDLALFQPGEKRDEVFRIIQVGGIHQRKGVQYLIRAFSEMRLPNSELWFVGGGLKSSTLGPIIRRYQADNIIFKGSYPQHELRQLYSQASIFVLASVADGFGMVVPQAMACGLPVIVTDHVGAADVVQDGRNGFVIPSRDINALKDRLLYCYENSAQCRLMGEHALRSIRLGSTWNNYGDRLVSYLHALMDCTQ